MEGRRICETSPPFVSLKADTFPRGGQLWEEETTQEHTGKALHDFVCGYPFRRKPSGFRRKIQLSRALPGGACGVSRADKPKRGGNAPCLPETVSRH